MKYINIIAGLALAFSALVLGILLYWMVFPLRVAEVVSPVKTEHLEYRVGETVRYDLDFCIYKKTKVTISKRFVDGTVHFLPSNDLVSDDMGCYNNKNVVGAVVPKGLAVGEYILKVTALHYVNPLKTVAVYWQTEPFQIVK